ncbi:hypothetical protein [Maribacter sp. IgM3_T14_3]|uniref:hypothetical protein n=1 Tax=Maribacter sp. IgM3_T14_3 TaxID=3415140 RepID=UPI003C6F95E8
MFQDKKVLFFSANFFGYQNEISAKLSSLGAEVEAYDERPKNTFFYKAMIRLDKRLLKKRLDKYYEDIIQNNSKTEYDFVFFLKAEAITEDKLEKLKKSQPKAKFVLYMWDSIENCPSVEKLFPQFDTIKSFDPADVKENKHLSFRALFYLDDYKNLNQSSDLKYDISFIGTGHTDRYEIVSRVKKLCNKNNWKYYFFIYLQDIKIFYARKLFSKAFRFAKKDDFSFNSLQKNDILNIVQNSKCVLDIERPVQRGLTMRTIEILGARKKLITTNKDIVNYDFYNSNNILVIERDNPRITLEFLEGPYIEIPTEVYQKYSIDNWIHEVFD